MQFHNILLFFLIVSCICISASDIDCNKIHTSCMACVRRVLTKDDINEACRRKVGTRWLWKHQTQCDIQRLYCLYPKASLNCEAIAQLAKMKQVPRSD